ncbi:drought-induced like 19, drought-induced 19, drought-induced 19-1 [Hibiscus trionum]|uniref:Drought-induced like 19, drought-induced 19, drought-induced 19-1 n=1 Tax=Hibiscus trionum TaxID=183268 RepID=A0A9W7M1W7_HIBTR|nr:drought-induced like 19, drought-induced 19, drought-induced 19-1 [Hibiscus trionum]
MLDDSLVPLPLSLTSGYMQRKRKSDKSGSHSTLLLLAKELREGNLQSLLGGYCVVSSSNSAPDPLSCSFILPMVGDFVFVQPHFSRETDTTEDSSDVNQSESERIVQLTPLSAKDQEEKAKRCKFIQGLLLSTILDGIL